MSSRSRLNFAHFIDWIILAGIGFIANQGVQKISTLSDSIDALNTKMAVMIATTSAHEERFKMLESRVYNLEMSSWKRK